MSPSRVLFVLSLLFILAGALLAQDKLKIKGRVLDVNGAAVAGADVLLNRSDVRFERRIVTDSGGNFEFDNLPAGTYRISATAKSFAAETK